MTDFANTAHAREQREAKAKAIARELYAELTPATRRELAKLAGVRPGSLETWSVVAQLLAARFTWDAAHPYSEEGHEYVAGIAEDLEATATRYGPHRPEDAATHSVAGRPFVLRAGRELPDGARELPDELRRQRQQLNDLAASGG